MKKITTLAVLIAGGIASGQALAAGSATLEMAGNILPNGCDISLPTTNLEWKNINTSSLSSTAFTDLPAKQVTLSVNCLAEMSFAVRAMDNRAGQLPTGTKPSLAKNYFNFSSGSDDRVAAAVYTIKALVNGSTAGKDKATAFITYKDGGWDWENPNKQSAYFINAKQSGDITAALDMSTTSGMTDYPRTKAKSKVFALEIEPSVGPLTGQNLAGGIDLQGSTTFEVIYM
ncbi:DUF1120 domain-containing protein [Erwinia rhapontici]|uniref:DUF1120 domain-containing protein n=1 Tax=Erwinia rhapontici TaxID=55212 RepID=UPI001D0DA816|nr:DUF1120 domain-containing protein [Erwinia rhapontici]UDQ79808.1 DUF1120 domain-containing protein [Erwinia rhapontici]